jgi:hypothetical protein
MEILACIQEAITNEKSVKASKPTKKKEVLSSMLQQQLDNNGTLAETFQKFSLFKQRKFREYIEK